MGSAEAAARGEAMGAVSSQRVRQISRLNERDIRASSLDA
jgi:hypothetical protein